MITKCLLPKTLEDKCNRPTLRPTKTDRHSLRIRCLLLQTRGRTRNGAIGIAYSHEQVFHFEGQTYRSGETELSLGPSSSCNSVSCRKASSSAISRTAPLGISGPHLIPPTLQLVLHGYRLLTLLLFGRRIRDMQLPIYCCVQPAGRSSPSWKGSWSKIRAGSVAKGVR
jgi:hypothetical protein